VQIHRFLVLLVVATLAADLAAQAQTESTIYVFNGFNGGRPVTGLVSDGSGNLFGTTGADAPNLGVVFELSPTSTGWNETTLYTFQSALDGEGPTSNLLFDAAGNIYGTTAFGGIVCGCGLVFELSPNSSGGWTKKTLYTFGGYIHDGENPAGNIAMDAAGNIYGSTAFGGLYGGGIIYELSPQPSGWRETVLFNFSQTIGTGGLPTGVVLDAAGNLYGNASVGGIVSSDCPAASCGTVWELNHTGGVWRLQVLHAFVGTDGSDPIGAVAFDGAGNLYGATYLGGKHQSGIVFQIPAPLSRADFHVIHLFNGRDGGLAPQAGVAVDSQGNLYGTTSQGGESEAVCQGAGCGLVYELTPSAGQWTFTVLHDFTGPDGWYITNPLILDSAGNIFGTSQLGGARNNQGTVFEITP